MTSTVLNGGTSLTSIRKRLDEIINTLSAMGTKPENGKTNNIAKQLSIIKRAFRESENSPACCFKHDANNNVVCDVIGPLETEQFMEQCKQCQAKIKKTLARLQTD